MTLTLFSVKGCLRCRIVKRFLNDAGSKFQEHDALGHGRAVFKAFYQQHRSEIHRSAMGIEFPIMRDEKTVRQGLPMVLAHLMSGSTLTGFLGRGSLRGSWVDGIHISGGNPNHGARLLELLAYLKARALQIRVDTNGLNLPLLKEVLAKGLADRVIMEVKGPLNLYSTILQCEVDHEEIMESIALVSRFNDYHFFTEIRPIDRGQRDVGPLRYLTPEEIAETALLIKMAAGDSRQPYRLYAFDPQQADSERLQACEALASKALFKYRTMARKHQFKTEIVSTAD